MWSKLDDALLDHPKIHRAGQLLGGKKKNGPALAQAAVSIALMWTNKQLTDGFLPHAVVANFWQFDQPLKVADAMVTATLWERVEGGFMIHDFLDHNFTAHEQRERRGRLTDVRARAGRIGGIYSGQAREANRKQKGSKHEP